MHTLIELYDERAIENFLGPETFNPKKVYYICPPEVIEDGHFKQVIRNFYRKRKISSRYEIIESDLYDTHRLRKQILKIVDNNNDCILDVTGGTDAALFAAGMISQEKKIPALTYSRKMNRFYNIYSAEFADDYPCTLEYSVEDFFVMAGGTLREGRSHANALKRYLDKFDDFFNIYLRHKREWTDFISFMTRISQPHNSEPFRLEIFGDYLQKGERGSRIPANEALLKELMQIGFLKNLQIVTDESVSFEFADEDVRFWLRDVGSVLELYMYKKCIDADIFSDVVSSAIVDWDGTNTKGSVSNEIDVVAARGVVPLFISCKICDLKTEAINELALLKDRFGGKVAKACIVTTEQVTASARHRAAQLGVTVIDIEELEQHSIESRLKTIMKIHK